MRNKSSVAALISRDRVIITSCIVLVTALAWAYLVHLHNQMSSPQVPGTLMAKMGMAINAPWGASDVFLTFLMWAVMMIGMMSATAALVQWALHDGALLSSGMAASSSRLAGAILIAAGVYQLTPAKGACLRQCQSPLGFLLSNWRDGAKGALQMGLRHGVYCLGCCWALMCVLFAVGVMNLAWVAALTAFILVEKFGHTGARVSRLGGILMVAFGVLVVVR